MHKRSFIKDQIDDFNSFAGHRPSFGLDTLKYSSRPVPTVDAVSSDLAERRGMELRDAFAARERAYAATERREQWKTTLDARTRLKVEPEEDEDDDDNGNGELPGPVGSAEYGQEGDHDLEPDDDLDQAPGEQLAGSAEYGRSGDYEWGNGDNDGDDDDDDVFKEPREYEHEGQYGSGEYGHSGGAPDASGIRASESPEDARDRARLERDRRGDQAWRTGPSLARANVNQRELDRWRGK